MQEIKLTVGDTEFIVGWIHGNVHFEDNFADKRHLVYHMLQSFCVDLIELDNLGDLRHVYRPTQGGHPLFPEVGPEEYQDYLKWQAERVRASLTEAEERALDSGGPDVD